MRQNGNNRENLKEQLKREDALLSKLKGQNELYTTLGEFLKSPVSVMLTISDLLESPLEQIKRQGLTKVLDELSTHISEVVTNVLDYDTLEYGKYPVTQKTLQLHLFLHYWLRDLKDKALQKGLELHVHIPPSFPFEVITDPACLEKIIFNLVSNAVKFTEKGKVVIGVEVRLENETEYLVEGWVRDTGIGMKSNNPEKFFSPFEKGRHDLPEYTGLGLGLTVTSRLIELLHGQLEVKTQPGRGSEFRFCLPLGKVKEKSRPSQVSRKWLNLN